MILATADVYSHLELRAILSPPDSLPLLLQICDTDHCEWWDLIYHRLSTGISAAIRDAEHLVWWGRFVFVFFFFLEGCEDNYLWVFLKDSGCVWNLFLWCWPQDRCHSQNPRPCELRRL